MRFEAEFLTVSDLARFLRTLRSVRCRIMADWVEDNPDATVTADMVGLLEHRICQLIETDAPARVADAFDNLMLSNTWKEVFLCVVADRLRPAKVRPPMNTAIRREWRTVSKWVNALMKKHQGKWGTEIGRRLAQEALRH